MLRELVSITEFEILAFLSIRGRTSDELAEFLDVHKHSVPVYMIRLREKYLVMPPVSNDHHYYLSLAGCSLIEKAKSLLEEKKSEEI